MLSKPELFSQIKHPHEVDEKFHIFSGDNISNVFFWNYIFSNLAKDNIIFDSIVECGVGRGRSLLTINQLLQIYLKTEIFNFKGTQFDEIVKVFGLDSFEGFPEPTEFDNSFRKPLKGEWSKSPSGKYQYNKEFIREIFNNASVTQENLELIKGFFEESVFNLKDKNLKIGILHLDGDLYESTKVPLKHLSDSVVKGGFIIFDDFILNTKEKDAFPGSRKAFKEFFEKNKNDFENFYSPRGNVILRKMN